MSGYRQPRIATIAPGTPFLDALAACLMDGSLVAGFSAQDDPTALARATIFVPTRRAARELRSVFLDRSHGRSAIMPRVVPLGEFDEDELLFAASGEAVLSTFPPIDALERQLELGALMANWTRHLTSRQTALYGGEEIRTPVSTADAFWMARDLAQLLDQMETEGLSFADVESAAAEADISEWWQVTASFLSILRAEWPEKLKEKKRTNPAAWRNAMLRAQAKLLADNPPDGPVVVAGSTGTIPATADLIAAVARLEHGAVVLPGYDTDMSEATRQALSDAGELASAAGHPQYGMVKLLKHIGATHDMVDVIPHGGERNALAARGKWVSAGLEPVPVTATWPELRALIPENAFDDVSILHAANERQEAAAIAAALREAIADPQTQVALVTPDRALARRVSAELEAHGILADDSGGVSFSATAHGQLLAGTLDAVFDDGNPVALLALLKNPLTRLGIEPDELAAGIEMLELLVLRGRKRPFTIVGLTEYADAQMASLAESRHKPVWFDALTTESVAAMHDVITRLKAALFPLLQLAARQDEVPVSTAVRASVSALEALATVSEGAENEIYGGDAGTALRRLLERFLVVDSQLRFSPQEWPGILEAATAGMVIKPDTRGHPRVSIWGALEARLQHVDLLVLGGLNEGTWPSLASNDIFLTRGVKDRIAMEPPERRIGLSAHDFQMAMGQPAVLLTRSMRSGTEPAVASRWLLRLETLAGKAASDAMRARGQRHADIAEAMNRVGEPKPAARPAPRPPVSVRPTNFSFTDIEKLWRDPYSVYADRILRLKPLDTLTRQPDAAERGTLIHAILQAGVDEGIDWTAADAETRLAAIADRMFDEAGLPEDTDRLWRLRFMAAIPEICTEERKREDSLFHRFTEARATPLPIGSTGATIRGQADRIDVLNDGKAQIIDFKTGNPPSAKQMAKLTAPQLPLEGAALERGAFADAGKCKTDDLQVVHLGSKGEIKTNSLKNARDKYDVSEVTAKAWKELEKLVAHFLSDNTPYLSRNAPLMQKGRQGDHDHLARVQEWASGAEGAEESDE